MHLQQNISEVGHLPNQLPCLWNLQKPTNYIWSVFCKLATCLTWILATQVVTIGDTRQTAGNLTSRSSSAVFLQTLTVSWFWVKQTYLPHNFNKNVNPFLGRCVCTVVIVCTQYSFHLWHASHFTTCIVTITLIELSWPFRFHEANHSHHRVLE
jgi:hypothetical protein